MGALLALAGDAYLAIGARRGVGDRVNGALLTACRPEGAYTAKSFWSWPMGPLLFKNESSDARDHCANERSTLLSLSALLPSASFLKHSPRRRE